MAIIFYVLRTEALPATFGSSSAVHRYFRFWYEQGVFQALWDERNTMVSGIDWTCLSADGCMTKVPLALETVGKKKMEAHAIYRQTAREFPWRCSKQGKPA